MSVPILVVMPVYNAEETIGEAIESILSQSFSDFEFLIVDDGSKDGSIRCIEAFHDQRIILRRQSNQGPGSIMNLAMDYAARNGIEFIARMDADDISSPDRIERQVELLNRNPRCAACSCNCIWIDPAGQPIGKSTVPVSNRIIQWEINHGLRGMVQGSSIFRTSALCEVGGYRAQFKCAEEIDLFLRLAERFEFTNAPEYLYRIRLRSQSLSMENVEENTAYFFYAHDCAKQRRQGLNERDYTTFIRELNGFQKLSIRRENLLLKYWRKNMQSKTLLDLIIAGVLDPKRVFARGLRLIDRLSVSHQE